MKKSFITLSIAALLVTGFGLGVPTEVFAHGNDANHQARHSQQRQADQARHDAGIPRQQDKVIHRQERRQDRSDHQLYKNNSNRYNMGYQNSGGIGSSLSNWLGRSSSAYPSAQYNVGAYGSAQSAPYYNNQNGANGVVNGYGTAGNGHVYTNDGHRLDHHGNHDDGPGDF